MTRILVVGDMMVDRYIHVTSNRFADEAPIPVWDEQKIETRLGGAANVAHNVAALAKDSDVKVFAAGILGDLNARSALTRVGVNVDMCVGGMTMLKHRYVMDDKILARSDSHTEFASEEVRFFESFVPGWMAEMSFDVIIVSDYNKGTMSERVVESLQKFPLKIVDSKRKNLRIYRGMDVLKINESEHSMQVSNSEVPYNETLDFFGCVVVTKGSKGATLIQLDRKKSTPTKYVTHSVEFPVDRVLIKDVTGCGDTHTAALAFSLSRDPQIEKAVRFANTCASRVVQKFGTSVP